ncbi:MAG: hypothetical protein WC679_12390 [Bacteroidales bacterium]|jgi:hypothetical protein
MAKGKLNILFVLALLLIITPILIDAKVSVVQQGQAGLEISYPNPEFIRINEAFAVRWWVYNFSDESILTNITTNCTYNLLNTSGHNVWRVASPNISFGVPSSSSACQNCFNVIINKQNFTLIGYYSYQIRCQSRLGQGGFINGNYIVQGVGLELTDGRSLLYFLEVGSLFLFFILILYFMGKLPDGETRDGEGNLISINNLKYFKSVLLFTDWMILIGIFYLLSNLAFAYLGERLVAQTMFMIYSICFRLTLPIVIVWFIWIFVQIAQDKKMKRLIQKGIFPAGKI